MDNPNWIPLQGGAFGQVMSHGAQGEEKALVDHLTPTGQRALLLLIVLLFLDLAVTNILHHRAHGRPSVAPKIFVAAAPVSPTFRVSSMALRQVPAPASIPTRDPAAVASAAAPSAPTGGTLADLEVPGETAFGATPMPEAVANDPDGYTEALPLKPSAPRHLRGKRLAALAHPAAVVAGPPAPPKRIASSILDCPPSFWAMTSMLDAKASRPQPIFNY